MAFREGVENSWVGRKIGRRGLILVVAGMSWVGSGFSIVSNPGIERFSRLGSQANDYLRIMDGTWVGYLWMVCGLFALVVGLLRHNPWIMHREVLGFNAILTPPALWFVTYIWSFITYFVTGGTQGRLSSAVALFVWGLVCVFIMIIAGWPEISREDLQKMDVPKPPTKKDD